MIIHTVASGESVYSIARRYGVPASRIIIDNELENPGDLVVGQTLVILYPTQTYTVMSGDTLESIAADFGVDVNQLYRNNPILGGRPDIFANQVLTISLEPPAFGEIAVNGYAYPFIREDVLRQTLPYLTYLSIFTYGIEDDGALIPPEGGDEKLIEIAKEYGTVPLMVLTSLTAEGNFSNSLVNSIIGSPALADVVVQNTLDVIRAKGYGGVDIDFEYISAEFADDYVRFVTDMRSALEQEGYIVIVALAPKTSSSQPGLLYEGHDYAALGNAADKVMLMTYEWGYTYSPPMAVAPIDKVRAVLDYAVTVIEPSDIFMGFPNYGYDWVLPFVRGNAATSVSNAGAVLLAREMNAEIQFDAVSQAPFFTYYDTTDNGSNQHIVWFEDARSVYAKLGLIPEYALHGVTVWNIMRYFPQLWLVLNSLFSIKKLS